jgi:hypothetical protein
MASAFEELTPPSALRPVTWYRGAMAMLRRAQRSRSGDAGPDFSRRWAFIYLALFVPALAAIVLSNWQWNAISVDTLLLISSFEMVERFSSLFSNANANPLQALFDILPSGLRLDMVPNMVGRLVLGPGMHIDFFYIFSGALLAFAVAAMARAAGLRWAVAVLAGILLPLLILPTSGIYPLADHFFIMWPVAYYSTAGTVLVTALFWRIDGRSWQWTAVLTAVIVLVLLHLSMIQILFMTLLVPGVVAMGVGALAASTSRRELLAKIACLGITIAALAGAGIFHYLYAIGIDTASHVFYQELMDFMLFSGPGWSIIVHDIGEVIMNPFTYNYKLYADINGVLAPLSQLGAVYLAVLGRTRRARIFGLTLLVWVVATAFAIAILHNFYYYTGLMYQGPHPTHFPAILWPYYAICLASLIFVLAEGGAALMSRAWPRARSASKYLPHGLAILALAGPVAATRILDSGATNSGFGGALFQTRLPPFTSYQRNSIVDYLDAQIGVAIDRDFRGSALSMPSDYYKDTRPYGNWHRETTFAYTRAYLGNDLGSFGLRYFDIPTLDQETHNITPHLYLVSRELLSRPGIDLYEKHFPLMTRLNEPIMALLGLRYIIADYELPFGRERLAMPIPEEVRAVLEAKRVFKSPVRVYELAHPNVGNYSPTKVVRAETARAAIVEMSRPDFDGRETVVTDDASIGGNLVPATGAAMTVRLGGVALQASSAGESVLVLPVQYSHCWRIVSGEGVSLFRANLMQLGVRFSGELRVELRQFFGPFWQSGCRVEDAADVERLRMVDAVGAGAELGKVPGNGINLIPAPAALDTLIANTAIASIKAGGTPNAPLREYTITAEGQSTEHYSMLSVPKLPPGPYTLSMQVRANGRSGVALQVMDGANGAFAEYLLPTRNVWTYRLGQGEKTNGTIRKIDDEWLQLTVTSTLMAETGYVVVQVLGRGNSRAFLPSGESVTIRAVKLEYGETATPYHAGGVGH